VDSNLVAAAAAATTTLAMMTENVVLKDEKQQVQQEPLSLAQLVLSVSAEMAGAKNMAKIRTFMESYDASRGDFKRFAFWDEKCNYTRNLVATDHETFTLMLLCWNPQKASPMHDHAGSQCFMRMIEGEVLETRCAFPTSQSNSEQPLQVIKQVLFKAPEVAFINDSLGLHKIENLASQRAVSLHCYIPPYDSCRCFLNPEKTSKAREVNITFYSEQGRRTTF